MLKINLFYTVGKIYLIHLLCFLNTYTLEFSEFILEKIRDMKEIWPCQLASISTYAEFPPKGSEIHMLAEVYIGFI